VIRCGQHPGFYCLFTNSLKTNCLSGLVHFHSRTSISKIIITSPLTCFQNLVITNGVLPDEFGGVPLLAEVRLQEGESLENALRRFKRKVQQEDIIKEVKRHSFYLKPGEKKRVKAALARKRARKKTRKEQD
jgi:small subunit ribosomal protein S21